MRIILIYIIFLLFSNFANGQKVYKATNPAYKKNKFSYKLYLFKDSSCYIIRYYPDNSVYNFYKGKLSHAHDSLYSFRYQPVVEFTSNKGYRYDDSLRVNLKQVDTVIKSFSYQVKASSSEWRNIELERDGATVYMKGTSKQSISVDTKFQDPLNGKSIIGTYNTNSYPDFTYYGSGTEIKSLSISITGNRLTIYPDLKHFNDQDGFILVK